MSSTSLGPWRHQLGKTVSDHGCGGGGKPDPRTSFAKSKRSSASQLEGLGANTPPPPNVLSVRDFRDEVPWKAARLPGNSRRWGPDHGSAPSMTSDVAEGDEVGQREIGKQSSPRKAPRARSLVLEI